MKPVIKTLAAIACVFLSACSTQSLSNFGRTAELPPSASFQSESAAFADTIRGRLKAARYMEARPLDNVSVPDWKGYPTRKFAYTQIDRNGTRRDAEAIMMNPSAEQLADWIVSASYSLEGRYDDAFCNKLFEHIIVCSGGQFVVRGICLEDMDGDGIQKGYPFQDGVTVSLRQIPGYPQRPLNAQETEAALESKPSDVISFSRKARLQSSLPSHWAAYTGTNEASGAAWLKIVRTEYQRAWNSRENRMLTATAKALGR